MTKDTDNIAKFLTLAASNKTDALRRETAQELQALLVEIINYCQRWQREIAAAEMHAHDDANLDSVS
jgi:hypothetical protein